MPSSASALDVLASGRLAGAIGRSEIEEDTFLFGYLSDCHSEDAVSLTMPVVSDQYDSMGTVHPIFEMNLPEGALLERLRHLFAKTVPNLDSLGLLEIVGQSQIGRLRYAQRGARPSEVPAQSVRELLTYAGTSDLFNDLLQRYASHSGISGVQPKVLLRAEETELPRATHRGATHIVKAFDPREYPELAANEYFCMVAARNAGIPVPSVSLSRNRRILVVERFDLGADGLYLGCEDFCVLSGMRAHGRYDGSYELVAKRIRQFVSAEHQQESLEQFFAMLALSCALENGDAHLKNYAVVYQDVDAPVRLAPVYDVVSTTLYRSRDVLALTMADSKQWPDRARLVKFARVSCGLTVAKTREILDHVQTGVEGAIAEVRRYAKEHAAFARFGERLIAALQRGVSRSIRAEP